MSSLIISEMDFDSQFAMPVANAENKLLEEELFQYQKDITIYSNDVENNHDRIHNMREHFVNVQQELSLSLGLIGAHKREIETEEHLYTIAKRQDERLCHEISKYESELELLRDRKSTYESKVFLQRQEMDNLKNQKQWDHKSLELWLEEAARRDEDAMTLQKYSTQDNLKSKELGHEIEQLTDTQQQKRKCLDLEMTQSLLAQTELDSCAGEFRRSHIHRQELIAQWENILEHMQARDNAILQGSTDLADLNEELRDKTRLINEKRNFHSNERQNNEELEKKIRFEQRNLANLRTDLVERNTKKSQLEDELQVLKSSVYTAAINLATMKTHLYNSRKDLIATYNKHQQAKSKRDKAKENLKASRRSTLSAEERAKIAEKAFIDEEETVKLLEVLLKKTREEQYRKKEELNQAMTAEKTTKAEIQGGRAAEKNLTLKIKKHDQDFIKQEEIIYDKEYTIEQMVQRLARLQGDINYDERLLLERKIKELTTTLERRHEVHNLLNILLKRLQDDIRIRSREIESIKLSQNDHQMKITELNLHNDISTRLLKKTTTKRHESLVDENMLKLTIKRMEGDLHKQADNVLTLEKQHLNLSTALEQRKQEIAIHRNSLVGQIRAAEDERHTISAELHGRSESIEKLKNRYDILIMSTEPPEGEDSKSQAYYVIKAARDKEKLQREGDDLDARVRKAEEEILALGNTTRLMNNKNDQYRDSFRKITETCVESELKVQADEQYRAAMDKLKYKRRMKRELEQDLQVMGHSMDTALRDENAYVAITEDRNESIKKLNKEIEEQQEKLKRVQNQLARSTREARAAQISMDPLMEEKDIDLRELRDTNKKILRKVAEAVQQFPDISNSLQEYFQQADLTLPAPGVGSRSSSTSSTRVRSGLLSSPGTSPIAAVSVVSSTRSAVSPKSLDLDADLTSLSMSTSLKQSSSPSFASALPDIQSDLSANEQKE